MTLFGVSYELTNVCVISGCSILSINSRMAKGNSILTENDLKLQVWSNSIPETEQLIKTDAIAAKSWIAPTDCLIWESLVDLGAERALVANAGSLASLNSGSISPRKELRQMCTEEVDPKAGVLEHVGVESQNELGQETCWHKCL